MSIENARLFIQRMKDDTEFAQKVSECRDADVRMAVAKEAGFDFTNLEMKEAVNERSDEELDMIVAGVDGWSLYRLNHRCRHDLPFPI